MQQLVLFGQLFQGPIRAWSWVELLIAIVILCAALGIAKVAMDYFGIIPPPWLIRIIMIVVVACVAIFAIRLVAGM